MEPTFPSRRESRSRAAANEAKTRNPKRPAQKRRHHTANVLYLYMLLQLLALVVVFMYLAFTISLYPFNYVFVVFFLMLTIIGFLRGLIMALLSSMFMIFGYGTIILYQLYVSQVIATIQTNDIFWLVTFPAGAVVSGLLGDRFNKWMEEFQNYKTSMEELVTIHRITGLPNERQFRMELQREISRALRYGHSLSVLFVEIAYFKEFTKDYSPLMIEQLLRQVSEKLEIILRNEDKKAYFGDGLFAAMLPETRADNLEHVMKRLDEGISTVRLESRKGRRNVEITLKYGQSSCPDEYQTVNELIGEARRKLDNYVV